MKVSLFHNALAYFSGYILLSHFFYVAIGAGALTFVVAPLTKGVASTFCTEAEQGQCLLDLYILSLDLRSEAPIQ